jgi:hypothetical protein
MGGKIADIPRRFKVNNHEPWVEWEEGDNTIPIKFKERG